ncbi:hypothetical protein ABPG74_017898 [Tetrahymena malaccensis]
MIQEIFQNQQLPTIETYQQNCEQDQEDVKYVISKKREQFQVQIRKGKRDEILNRKRVEKMNILKQSLEDKLKGFHLIYEEQSVIPLIKSVQGQELDLDVQFRMQQMLSQINYLNVDSSQQKQLEQSILTPNTPEDLLISFKKYRYLILEEKVFCADIDLNLSEKLVQMLTQLQQYPAIIYEVVQLLSIISSGTRKQVDSIINIGGINIIDNIFNEYDYSVLIQEQLVEVIGNLIADKQINRDLIMKSGIIDKILTTNHKDILYIRTAIWAICNICCMKEFCKFCDLQNFLPTFLSIIKNYPADKQLVSDSLLSLSILAKQATRLDELELFCSEELAECLKINLQAPINSIRERALKVLTNLTEKKHIQSVSTFIYSNKFDQNIIQELLIKHYKKENKKVKQGVENVDQNEMQIINEGLQICSNFSTRKYAIIAIQNLIEKDERYLSYLLESQNLIQVLINTLLKEQKQNNILSVLYILESIFYDKKYNIIDSLVDSQFFEALYYLFDYQEKDILQICLQLVYDILSCLQNLQNNNVMQEDFINTRNNLESAIDKINDYGVIKKIIELQGNRSKDVSEISMDILDKFFPDIQ